MKNSYNNLSEVTLMTYPMTPKERKGTPAICIYVKDGFELNPGDEIKASGSSEQVSVYHIKEITETRPASLRGYTFIRAISEWELRSLK